MSDAASTSTATPAEPVISVPAGYTERKEVIRFRTTKDKETGVETKRPEITLCFPALTVDGLGDALVDEKQVAFILEVLNAEIYSAVRDQTDSDESPVNTQDELDLSKLTLAYLANQPKAQRGSSGIPQEVWDSFAEDYLQTTLTLHPERGAKKVGNAAALLKKKLVPIKTEKPVLAFFKQELEDWSATTSNLDNFQKIYDNLMGKIDTWSESDPAKLLASLA